VIELFKKNTIMRYIFIVLLFPLFVKSQIGSNNMYLYAKAGGGSVDTALFSNISFSGEYLVKPYLGLNYNFDFVHRNDSLFQFHSTLGPVAAPIVFISQFSFINLGNNVGAQLGIVLLALLIPDGVSFHIPYRYSYDFSPYVNILGFDYVKNKNTNQRNCRYAASFGFKASYCFGTNMTVMAYTETRKVSTMGWSLGGGIGIGYTFTSENIKNLNVFRR
jgi:hypothetical protein